MAVSMVEQGNCSSCSSTTFPRQTVKFCLFFCLFFFLTKKIFSSIQQFNTNYKSLRVGFSTSRYRKEGNWHHKACLVEFQDADLTTLSEQKGTQAGHRSSAKEGQHRSSRFLARSGAVPSAQQSLRHGSLQRAGAHAAPGAVTCRTSLAFLLGSAQCMKGATDSDLQHVLRLRQLLRGAHAS